MDGDIILYEKIRISDDQKAFEYLYYAYFPALCSYAFGFLKNHADTEDIVNDCFYEFWKNRKTLEIKSSIKSYLFISVRNRAINFLKKNTSKNKYLSDQSYPLAFEEEIAFQTERLLMIDNLEDTLRKAIEQLPSQCRYIFQLNRFEGLKYKEIAEKLNLTEATIKTQIARALKNLRSNLENLRSGLLFFLFTRRII